MKKRILSIAVVLLLISSVSAYAWTPVTTSMDKITEEVIDNLIVGVQSDNLGLRISCAYYLGEYNADKAVIPLMKMLHSEKTEEARIVAALALVKIGSKKGHFAVKQAIRFDESERVRNLCAKFYDALYNKSYNAKL